ncbi:FAR1-related sequence 5-like protein, partial [Tanacetum coccineum]
ETSTPYSINNVQDAVIGDDQSIPHDEVSKLLVGLFRNDEKAKQYFDVYGDVVSFDAIFRSNRYNIILVPFTVINDHNWCILFGSASLDSEHIKKYRWLLKQFKKIFGKAPKVVVTDQDPAMKVAIKEIFPDSRHYLCMWHIMKKLVGKVGPNLCSNTDFKKCLCDIVWTDRIDPDVFECEWNSIMLDFKLNEHKWLNDMFGKRYNWIPAYFLLGFNNLGNH